VIGVVDAFALIRLFIPDGPVPAGLEPFLRRVEQGTHTALAPELLSAETEYKKPVTLCFFYAFSVSCLDFTSIKS
jgi:hypothetical protein